MMNKIFFIFSVVVLFSCKENKTTTNTRSSNSLENFDNFIKEISAEPTFQEERVIFPCPIKSFGEESNDTITEYLAIKDWRHIDFSMDSSASKRDEDAFKKLVKKRSDFLIIYSRVGIDNGIHIEYYFGCKKNKWYLIQIIDYSS